MRSVFFIPAVIFGISACDDENLTRVAGKLELPEVIDFGDVQVGIERTLSLEVKNSGNGTVVIEAIDLDPTFTGELYDFRISRDGFTVQPSEVKTLSVSFRPYAPSETPYESKLTLATDEPIDVVVRGRGVESGLIVTPNPVDFGSVLTGSTKIIDVTVTNALAETVRVTAPTANGGVEVEQAGGEVFAVDASVGLDGLIAELAPGASVTLPVAYTPIVADQPDRGRFYLSNCDSNLCQVAVSLIGRGSSFALVCAPAELDFGAVHPGVTRTLMTSCMNSAGSDIRIQDVGMTLSTAAEYRLVPPQLPVDLPAGTAMSIAVEYTPTQSTYDSGATPQGAVEIESVDPMGRGLDAVLVALTGSAGGPSIDVLPRSLDFGMIALGTSHTKRLLVINNGYEELIVGNIDPDAAATGAFTADQSNLVVASGGSALLEVTFAPQLEGPASSMLIMSTNDAANATLDVMLFGTGVDLPPCAHQIAPPTLNFGVVTLGGSPVASAAIENVGTNDCLVNDIEFIDPAFGAPNLFELVNGVETGIIIAPGGRHEIPVRYTPAGAVTDRATIGFYVNDPRDSNPELPVIGVGESTLSIQCPANVATAVGTPVSLTVSAQVSGANITGYQWTIGGAPTGGIGTPNQWTPNPPTAATESFLPFIVGTYDIMATVLDDLGRSSSCTTQVIAQGEGLVVTLTWNGSGDVDLHVHNPNPTPWFGSTDDCYYGNRTPVWDPASPAGQGSNPELDFDNVISNGPENTRVSTVLIGQPYTIGVHNYSSAAGRTATLDIFCGGVTAPTYTASSNPLAGGLGGQCTNNDFWRVATVVFTSQSTCTVTPIDTYNPSSQACTSF